MKTPKIAGKTTRRAASPAEAPPTLPLFTIRGQRVILDADLAHIYGVPTFRFNEAIKRNLNRFPEDFAFQLNTAEFDNLKTTLTSADSRPSRRIANSSQIAMSPERCNIESIERQDDTVFLSHFASGKSSHRGKAYLPWAFTEHGALMVANILRSERAVQMSVYVVRAFVRQREQLLANAAILKHLAEIDSTLLEHDQALRAIWTELQPLLNPPPVPPKPPIGFS